MGLPEPGGLGALLAARGLKMSEAAGEAPPAQVPAASGGAKDPFVGVPKVVLAMERKGRGGRTVTLVRGLPPGSLDDAARALKRALGCGAAVEEDAVVVQGDQRDRLRPWLERAGVRHVAG